MHVRNLDFGFDWFLGVADEVIESFGLDSNEALKLPFFADEFLNTWFPRSHVQQWIRMEEGSVEDADG
jgi:hypothetical protein